MKRLITFIFVLAAFQMFAQLYPVYSPVKVGNFNLQAEKVFYQKFFPNGIDMDKLAEQLKSKQQVNSIFNINSVTAEEIKGTISSYQLDIDQFGIKRKKLGAFLVMPLHGTFNIESDGNGYKVTVSGIWFNSPSGRGGQMYYGMENLFVKKRKTVFWKKKKALRSMAAIDKNLTDLFSGNGYMGW